MRGRAPRSAAGLFTVPFNEIDEAFLCAPRTDAPLAIEIEARAAGRLDEQRLRDAVARASRPHPMARARLSPSGHGWEIADHPDVDPLVAIDCADDADLDAARDELLRAIVPIDLAPPFRLVLARHPAGDALVLTAPHAFTDGTGALCLMRSILRAYAGEPEPVPPVDPVQARSLEGRFGSPWSPDWIDRVRTIEQVQRESWLAPPVRLASEGGADLPGCGVHHLRVPAEVAGISSGRFAAATLNDRLLAALACAIARWNQEHGAPPGRVALMVPVNLRPRAWRREVIANLSLAAGVSVGPRELADPAALLRHVAAQTARIKASPEAAVMIDVLRVASAIPSRWRSSGAELFAAWTGGRFVPTAALSNLGRIDDALSLGEEGPATEVSFSPPCPAPMGLAVGALSYRGSMFLSLRYPRRVLSPAAVRRFAGVLLASLQRVG